MKYLVGLIFILASQFSAYAQEAEKNTGTTGIDNWGLGFGLGVEQYKDPYIDRASLRGDTRIVTTEKTYETLPSAWLTINWNYGIDGKQKHSNTVQEHGFGFFAGVKLLDSNAEAFSAFALGPQVSFVLKEKVISVGLGWVTHQTRGFANGISNGLPLPPQFDDIVYEEGTENSYMLMMSVQL